MRACLALAAAGLLLACVAVAVGASRRVEGMSLRRPSESDRLRGLALTCASTAEGRGECGQLWGECVRGDSGDACGALKEAGGMARSRHGPGHPLVRRLT